MVSERVLATLKVYFNIDSVGKYDQRKVLYMVYKDD